MGELPPLPTNCCALSHLRGTPTKSPRKGKGASTTEVSAKPTRLFTSARISMKRNNLTNDEGSGSCSKPTTTSSSSRRSLPVAIDVGTESLPRRRGRPALALATRRLLPDETDSMAREHSVESSDGCASGGELMSAKQKAAVTKNIVERKRKLLAELEHPRKSPREHASTLAILSCLLQQRQLNEKAAGGGGRRSGEKKGDQHDNNNSEEDVMSSDRNSETASERRDSTDFKTKQEVEEEEEEVVKKADEDEDGSSEVMAATTTTDGDTTENEIAVPGIGGHTRSRSRAAITNPEDTLPLPMTPPPVPGSRTNTPGLKRSHSSMSNQSNSNNKKTKKKKKHSHWRAMRDSINPQELNREIESLLMDPLNASAESIDCKVLDKSDAFLVPFHECPDFHELVLSVDEADYKQGYVRKSFAPKKSTPRVTPPVKNTILQLDYQLRSTKKRKNRTGWPTNKRRTSAMAGHQKKESSGGSSSSSSNKRSVSCDGAKVTEVANDEVEEQEQEQEGVEADAEGEEEKLESENDPGKTSLTIITEPPGDPPGTKDPDQLQKSPILRKLLSPQWKRSSPSMAQEVGKETLMPSPGGIARATSSSPNGLKRGNRGDRTTPVSDLLMMECCDESQSVSSSVSVMVSDDPDGGQMLSSDNNTNPAAQSPSSALRLFKQTTLSRFFSRKKASPTIPTSAAASAAGDDKEKENENVEATTTTTTENCQEEEEDNDNEGKTTRNGEAVDGDVSEAEEEEEENEAAAMEVDEAAGDPEEEDHEHEEEVAAPKAEGRRKGESKLKNGINMNPIISIKKLPALAKVAVGANKAKRKGNRSSSGQQQVGIRSMRQRRRKIV